MTTKISFTEEEREQIKYALENRIEYLVYSLHMPPMSDGVQVSIIALDSMGFEDTAQGYREQLKEWQDMYDNDNYPDYGE